MAALTKDARGNERHRKINEWMDKYYPEVPRLAHTSQAIVNGTASAKNLMATADQLKDSQTKINEPMNTNTFEVAGYLAGREIVHKSANEIKKNLIDLIAGRFRGVRVDRLYLNVCLQSEADVKELHSFLTQTADCLSKYKPSVDILSPSELAEKVERRKANTLNNLLQTINNELAEAVVKGEDTFKVFEEGNFGYEFAQQIHKHLLDAHYVVGFSENEGKGLFVWDLQNTVKNAPKQ